MFQSQQMSRQAKNIDGSIPLHVAAIEGHLPTFQLLLEDDGKADISIPDLVGNTPLHYAVYNNRTEVVKHIVQNYPATINVMFLRQENGANYTALDIAKKTNIRQILLDNDAKGSIEIGLEKNDFKIAVDKDVTLFEKMSNEKLLQLCRQSNNCPILYIFAMFKSLNHRIEDLKTFMVNGTDMDSWVSPNGNNALHLCARNGHFDGAKLLLRVSDFTATSSLKYLTLKQ